MYINETKVRSVSQDLNLKRNLTNSNQEIINELNTLLSLMNIHLKGSELEKTTNWILQQDLWLRNENNCLQSYFYNYSRGDIILSVDLGTSNIGTEIRYPHPCVVLYDNNEDWLIVAPLTAAQIDVNGDPIIHPPFEVLARKQRRQPPNGEFMFKKHTVIQVDQIQRISKYKILNKMSLKLKTDLLNQIDNVIVEYYTPLKSRLISNMIDLNRQQNDEIKEKNEQIRLLKNQISKLTSELIKIGKKPSDLKSMVENDSDKEENKKII